MVVLAHIAPEAALAIGQVVGAGAGHALERIARRIGVTAIGMLGQIVAIGIASAGRDRALPVAGVAAGAGLLALAQQQGVLVRVQIPGLG